ncbi:ribosome biogenesis GTPase Der [Thermanaerothrix sp. 4228-RoL]|jgi:GTP-binding protein|uniref:GTPase Der n=1 Tax=Thermanaerothrix solaris TaxID=3058434 RepID=A0ABU3NPI2_9CHLR|nr:ribosome biogenesis GTPase Der [Thermanaerothrix sp. 4228-RoL]MDT8898747.1 ribosome biogenesis GTPase Der [Thermanaerothrix sp. 4228-RoL]
MSKPLVALVGRPNVGKSTLFNRLVGEPLAIVDGTPGTTRDRLIAEAEWTGHPFLVVDTGGIDPRVGGERPLSVGSAEYIDQIRAQAEMAIEDADVVLFLVDANDGVTPADQEVANLIRRKQRMVGGQPQPPVLLVVNKADNESLRQQAAQFYELGLGEPYPVSALHGLGIGDLLDEVVARFPAAVEAEEEEAVKIAIVGRPNVGKSSLLNRLVGEERAIVSPIAGTTRDAIDTPIEYQGIPIVLIDTAGIRRRGRIEPGVEKYSVLRTLRAIERCDVALLMIDATAGVTAQDAHIAGYILDANKSVVVLVNKWDAVTKDSQTMQEYTQRIRQELNFMDYVPILFISAKTGQRVDQVLPLALKVQEERLAHLPTAHLNRILQAAQDAHTPTSRTGKSLRIYYGTQVRTDPPTFLIYVNDPKLAHFTYLRYLENCIRREYPFTGTPIRLVLKPRR